MLELYGYWRSQAAYRVRIAMSLKGLEWREHLVDLLKGEQFAGAVAEHNPHHAVPVLIDGSASGRPGAGPDAPRILTQSLAIIDYLDDLHPNPPLLPVDAYERAKVRAFSLIAIADSHPLVVPRVRKRLAEQLKASPADVTAWNNHWQTLASAAMEKTLAERTRQTPFCFGDEPGLADMTAKMAKALDLPQVKVHVYEIPAVNGLAAYRSQTMRLDNNASTFELQSQVTGLSYPRRAKK